MKAIICSEFGPVESLTLKSIDAEPPGAGQVQIEVHACGINFPDILLVQGKYQVRPDLPFSPGGEVAGIVREVGDDVTSLSVGQRVMAVVFWGGLRERVNADVKSVIALPDSIDFLTASIFQGGYTTSYYALKQRARLQQGETLLVLGAAGGVGLAAVQLGRAMGARVIAAVSSEAKQAFVKQHGAEECINYSEDDLRDSVKALTAGRGVDVVYDPVGGDQFDLAARCMNWNGRLLVVGFASGRIPQLPTNLTLLKGYSLVGVFYQRFFDDEHDTARQNIAELLEMTEAGTLRPAIDRVFPFEDAADAIGYVAERKAMGKVAVKIRD